MADEVIVRIRDHGPALLEGPVKLLDADGNVFPRDASKPVVALCRCGHSKNRPFCDGSHKTCGFQSSERAPRE